MQFHHGGDYNEAASAAAKHARSKLEAQIEKGRTSGAAIIEKVQNEVCADAILNTAALRATFVDDQARLWVDNAGAGADWALHKHGFRQLVNRANLPLQLANKWREGAIWERDLLSHNLAQIHAHAETRTLVRAVHGEARGILSDRYRRLDSRPIIEAFAGGCQAHGFVPIDGIATDTRWEIKALMVKLFEPVPNEVIAFGLSLKNSDFGHGKLEVSIVIDRPWCTNFCRMQDQLSRVHLGGRLPDNLQLSQRTVDLDTETHVSLIDDIVKEALSPHEVGRMLAEIKQADEEKIPWGTAARKLKALNKGELERVKNDFESTEQVTHLPPTPGTKWRLSNAVSWLANNVEPDRKLELQKLAGDILN